MPKQILMCPPTYFDIEYEINVWMHQDDQPTGETAQEQWDKLHAIYTDKLGWDVELIDPVKGLPDMVFATDCCLKVGDKILLSSFRFSERQPETGHFEKWFKDQGYQSVYVLQGGIWNLRWASHNIKGKQFLQDLVVNVPEQNQ